MGMSGYDDELSALAALQMTDDLADIGAAMALSRQHDHRAVHPAVRAAAARAQAASRGVPYSAMVPGTPGVPKPGARLQPIGFPNISFTATSGTSLQTQAAPQRPFRPRRQVISLARNGTSATGLLTLTEVLVGTANQLVGSGPISVDAFAPIAYDTNVWFDPATPGILLTVVIDVSLAPLMTDTIDVNVTWFGDAIG